MQIKYDDVYKEVKNWRDFEITNLWQRSVFLVAFLMAILSAYGNVALKIWFSQSDCNITGQHHFIAGCICFLGYVFSLLWIMMAKGSKYTFEQYENAIQWFTDTPEFTQGLKKDTPTYGNLGELESNKCDLNVFSTLAGKFSVSRINIFIGITFLFCFSILNMIHLANFFISAGFESLVCAILGISICISVNVIFGLVIFLYCKTSKKNG